MSASAFSSSEEQSAFLRGVAPSQLSPLAQQLLADTQQLFHTHFGQHADVSGGIAPGRVNLIGEHTDYNDGFVMPLAIDRHTIVVGRRNGGDKWRIVSANASQDSSASAAAASHANASASGDAMSDSAPAAAPASAATPSVVELDRATLLTPTPVSARAWHDYFRGVVAQFVANGHDVPCCDVAICGNVPLGGGLSSSASLEVATASFLQSLLNLPLDPLTRALWCQKAEHEFAHCPCGIMDQFVSSAAEKDHVLLLDCRSKQPALVPFTDPSVALLITNSNVKHSLGDGAYEKRVSECARAVKALQMKWPEIAKLRDATLPQVMALEEAMDEEAFYRARHVVMENDRTQQAAVCLSRGEYPRLGQLLTFSHVSLKNDYEVSCDEVDCLVDIALELPGVYGSRMTGGGFGGCTVTLVKADEVDKVAEAIQAEYKERTGIDAVCIVTRPGPGAAIINLNAQQ